MPKAVKAVPQSVQKSSRKSIVNSDKFANALAKDTLKQDERIKADSGRNSPSAAAATALAYMKNVVLDDLVGSQLRSTSRLSLMEKLKKKLMPRLPDTTSRLTMAVQDYQSQELAKLQIWHSEKLMQVVRILS